MWVICGVLYITQSKCLIIKYMNHVVCNVFIFFAHLLWLFRLSISVSYDYQSARQISAWGKQGMGAALIDCCLPKTVGCPWSDSPLFLGNSPLSEYSTVGCRRLSVADSDAFMFYYSYPFLHVFCLIVWLFQIKSVILHSNAGRMVRLLLVPAGYAGSNWYQLTYY